MGYTKAVQYQRW
jgi:hypothetical protein